MNEEQLFAIIDNLTKRVEAAEKMLTACMENVESCNTLIRDKVINPVIEAYNKAEDDYNYGEFSKKYSDRLAPYAGIIKAEDGEDTDVVRSAYDSYKGYTDEEKEAMTEDEYIDKLITALDEHIAKIRESLGLGSDAEVSVTSTEEGKLEVEVNGEPIAEATEEGIAATEDATENAAEEGAAAASEEPAEEEVTTEETTTEEEPVAGEEVTGTEKTAEEESNDFYQELLRDREKYMKGR